MSRKKIEKETERVVKKSQEGGRRKAKETNVEKKEWSNIRTEKNREDERKAGKREK